MGESWNKEILKIIFEIIGKEKIFKLNYQVVDIICNRYLFIK